jgi:hypothetical protein
MVAIATLGMMGRKEHESRAAIYMRCDLYARTATGTATFVSMSDAMVARSGFANGGARRAFSTHIRPLLLQLSNLISPPASGCPPREGRCAG